ncbi:hypothetical protein HUJ05_004344 [Dendroctonus ponderosae]|nr:hypothetical protein HUJ05_004344 [Dendroctonus ponderosae]
MHVEVKRYANYCIICASAKAQHRLNKAPMTARSPEFPFESLAMDILGPYPASGPNKSQSILQVEDVFSKRLEAKAFTEIHGQDVHYGKIRDEDHNFR